MKTHHYSFFLVFLIFVATVPQANAQMTDSAPMLDDIRAYLKIDDNLSTAGQIAYDQIEMLKESGFDMVINLATADESRNGLEGFLVTQQGLSYVHIPVSWQNPAERDLQMFFEIMNANRDRKIFVHCFANMRVSAFVYLYRTLQEGLSEEEAKADLAKIWDPASQAQWSNFIDQMQQKYAAGS